VSQHEPDYRAVEECGPASERPEYMNPSRVPDPRGQRKSGAMSPRSAEYVTCMLSFLLMEWAQIALHPVREAPTFLSSQDSHRHSRAWCLGALVPKDCPI
jgi:hypothetical protein